MCARYTADASGRPKQKSAESSIPKNRDRGLGGTTLIHAPSRTHLFLPLTPVLRCAYQLTILPTDDCRPHKVFHTELQGRFPILSIKASHQLLSLWDVPFRYWSSSTPYSDINCSLWAFVLSRGFMKSIRSEFYSAGRVPTSPIPPNHFSAL